MFAAFSKLVDASNFWRYVFIFLGACSLAFLFFESLSGILVPFFAAWVGAYILNAPVRSLTRHNVPRSLAAALVILAVISGVILLLFGAIPYIEHELSLLVENFPKIIGRLVSRFSPAFGHLQEKYRFLEVGDIKGQLLENMGSFVQWGIRFLINLLSQGSRLATLLSFIVLTPIILFYLLRDWPRLTDSFYLQFIPSSWEPFARNLFHELHMTLRSYGKGQSIVCCLLMVLYSTLLFLVSLKQAFLIGILSGVFSFIPYLGMLIGLLMSLSVALSQFTDWGGVVSVLLIYVMVPLIEGNFLYPRLVGKRIGLHPVWVLFSLLAGGTWFGFLGVLFAVPVAGMVTTLIRVLKREGLELPASLPH